MPRTKRNNNPVFPLTLKGGSGVIHLLVEKHLSVLASTVSGGIFGGFFSSRLIQTERQVLASYVGLSIIRSVNKMKNIQISKIDAARRQILTAIRLYFNHDDIVSIHTLAAAAFKITQNICDSSDELPESITSWIDDLIIQDYKKTFFKKFHETANFLKHADHDPNTTHEFAPQETENLLFIAIHQYHLLTGEYSPEIRLFSTWYRMQHPESFKTPQEVLTLGEDLFRHDRNEFWRQLLPLLKEQYES